MWRGAISFGLVNIGVRLYAATEDHDYHFHQVHRTDHGRIRHKRVCDQCGKEVDYDDIVKGYQTADGKLVVLDSEDFDQLPIRTDRSIDLLEFVPTEHIDPIHFQRTYYLEPEKAALRPYELLREALERTDRMAVVKITMRRRETLATIRSWNDLLLMHTMLWPDEIREPDFAFLGEDANISRQELEMATSLVENMSGEFDPEEFTDDYQRALGELIEAKAQGVEPPEPAERPAEEGAVVDLMSALERSVDQSQSRTRRARAGETAERGGTKSAAGRRASTTAKSGRSSSGRKTGSRSGGKSGKTKRGA